ncbi:MAG: molybdopterin biosynthesis protein [Thioalkalivibrio sp.]
MSDVSSNARTRDRAALDQQQFLEVVTRDEAHQRFESHIRLGPLGTEEVSLLEALGRVLACTVHSPVDVPGFDRANVDGFAVQAADTHGAMEHAPRRLRLNDEILVPGQVPRGEVLPGTATPVATGAMLPRGADAVLMVEHTELGSEVEASLEVAHPVAAGQFIGFAGSDIAMGEVVLRTGQLLGSRELGVLAAIGCEPVTVYRRPRVAIISTGDELVAPGTPMRPGAVYDSNGAILAGAVVEQGGEPLMLGIVPDEEDRIEEAVRRALSECDVVLLSGGTSKGAGDLSYRVLEGLGQPGILAHGVALKPGKPICLAVMDGKPLAVLPGFPTSAIFTFHEFVAPVVRAFAGLPVERGEEIDAQLPIRINAERGRTEYLLVSLVRSAQGLAAYPMGGGSGSVTAFSYADGFITIPQQAEILHAGESVRVRLLGRSVEPADVVAIGSHCLGLDLLLNELQSRGMRVKALHVGSQGGLAAARRGECDIAGVHLMDPQTGIYNRPFLEPGMHLVSGYHRMQGLVFKPADPRFHDADVDTALGRALADPACRLVNRNPGSGTRILLDGLLNDARPPGYDLQVKSHHAVATTVIQGRADWGMAIETVARQYGLGFIPYKEEAYDLVIPESRLEGRGVQALIGLLGDPLIRERLAALGFRSGDEAASEDGGPAV